MIQIYVNELFFLTALISTTDIKQLISKDTNKEVIIYYKIDYLRIITFLEEIRIEEEVKEELLEKFEGLAENSWSLFDKLGKRVNPREGEPTSFLPIPANAIDISNALVPMVESVLENCKNNNKFENSQQWWEQWVEFKGDPYVFKGLPAALYAKEYAARMTKNNFINVFLIHALPRWFGFHFDTWDREEIEILWLGNCFIEKYERIDDEPMTDQSWNDFNYYQQLQHFMSSNKYGSEIQFKDKTNARHLMRVCLNLDGYNFGFKDIAKYSDLYTNKMRHNIILLAQILHQKVLFFFFLCVFLVVVVVFLVVVCFFSGCLFFYTV